MLYNVHTGTNEYSRENGDFNHTFENQIIQFKRTIQYV